MQIFIKISGNARDAMHDLYQWQPSRVSSYVRHSRDTLTRPAGYSKRQSISQLPGSSGFYSRTCRLRAHVQQIHQMLPGSHGAISTMSHLHWNYCQRALTHYIRNDRGYNEERLCGDRLFDRYLVIEVEIVYY